MIGTVRKALEGIVIGALIFLTAAFFLAIVAEYSNKSTVEIKILDAVRTSAIQTPGAWDVNDRRGIDTFTDCLVLQTAILDHGHLLDDMFDALIFKESFVKPETRPHPCNTLAKNVSGHGNSESNATITFNRYWMGSATVARIVLGLTRISFESYRQIIFLLSLGCLSLFVLIFVISNGRSSIVFLPVFLSVVVGYGLLIFGQSIAHAPELIVALLLLSVYSLGGLLRSSIRSRALWYSFLGCVCVYFDLLDANVVLIAILLCCQLVALRIAQADNAHTDDKSTESGCMVFLRDITANWGFLMAGGSAAIILRIAGYSISSHINIGDAASLWVSELSHRVSGTAGPTNTVPSLKDALLALKQFRGYPFHGFLDTRNADAFYGLGLIAWALSLWLCWEGYRKGAGVSCIAISFIMAASLVPGWFLIFKQHTVLHAWMTGRLVSVFCGLGMSLAVYVGWRYWQRRFA